MTNKEKFKEVFGIEIDCGSCNPYPCNENDCEFWEKCESEPVRPCDSWWDWEFKEPTTENDLEVDCISRFEVTEIINEEWDTDIILDRIEALPSVTPQAKDVSDNNAGEILDKIRAEIAELHDSYNKDGYHDEADALAFAMKVIDKHKAETEK